MREAISGAIRYARSVEHIGRRIKQARGKRSQQDLASALFVITGDTPALTTINRWERTGRIRADLLEAVAQALGVDPCWLLTGSTTLPRAPETDHTSGT